MLPRLSLVATSMLVMGIPAASTVVPPTQPQNTPLCCNALVPPTTTAATAIAGLLGLDVSGLPGLVGLVCNGFNDHCVDNTPMFCAPPSPQWGLLIAVNCVFASL
ncbi:hypothetical protein C8J57DRAFT_552584 [Mycena rebaudengoi]|nr:hypothetical protein C8J57DRAFT_552584 [Mycena rebaudengoi]